MDAESKFNFFDLMLEICFQVQITMKQIIHLTLPDTLSLLSGLEDGS